MEILKGSINDRSWKKRRTDGRIGLGHEGKGMFSAEKEKIYIGYIETKFAAKREMESLYA